MGHLSIVVTSSSVKTVEEFSQDLVFGLSSSDEIFVLSYTIFSSYVVGADKSVSILVHAGESALNHGQFARRKLISESSNELFIADVAITIDVIGAQEALQINFLREEPKSSQSLLEFFNIKLLVSIVVAI